MVGEERSAPSAGLEARIVWVWTSIPSASAWRRRSRCAALNSTTQMRRGGWFTWEFLEVEVTRVGYRASFACGRGCAAPGH